MLAGEEEVSPVGWYLFDDVYNTTGRGSAAGQLPVKCWSTDVCNMHIAQKFDFETQLGPVGLQVVVKNRVKILASPH